ncbi:MAG: DUF4035 domain-containing protein [Acidimicrobiia bacterium]|nr:DUF4035 domain-containing protein [Acidimicrobiia bacterium]
MGKTVEQLQAEITSREFAEWIAYDRLEPIGDDRSDHMIAQLTAILANIHRRPGTKAYTVTDFLLFRPKRTHWQEMRAKLKQWSGGVIHNWQKVSRGLSRGKE